MAYPAASYLEAGQEIVIRDGKLHGCPPIHVSLLVEVRPGEHRRRCAYIYADHSSAVGYVTEPANPGHCPTYVLYDETNTARARWDAQVKRAHDEEKSR